MAWGDQLFIYCERGSDPSFWAEPFNAVSNAAFLVAAAAATVKWLGVDRRAPAEAVLIAIVAVIGVGSFLFHTFATRWAALADVAPIGIFMIAYLIYALRRFLDAPWYAITLAVGAFLAAGQAADGAPCASGLLPITEAMGRPCLNGSLAYSPALIALAMLAAMLTWRSHEVASRVALAAAVLTVSITLRSLDFEICAMSELFGRARGAHAVWHVLNALVLYLLLSAAIASRDPGSQRRL